MSDLPILHSEDSAIKFDDQANKLKNKQLTNEIKSKQNFFFAVLGGFVATIIAACLWALATYVTGYKLVFMPIIIGLIVGFAVRFLGKGTTFLYGLVGALFSLLGCFSGHFLAMVAAVASFRGISIFTVLLAILNVGINEEIFEESFSTTELVLYVVAICIGFVLSFYRINGKK